MADTRSGNAQNSEEGVSVAYSKLRAPHRGVSWSLRVYDIARGFPPYSCWVQLQSSLVHDALFDVALILC